jgi:hypothetical protein
LSERIAQAVAIGREREIERESERIELSLFHWRKELMIDGIPVMNHGIEEIT